MSVMELSHDLHPLKFKTMQGDRLSPYIEAETGRMAAHELPRVYVRNCSVYATRRETIDAGQIIGDDCRGYVMPRERSLDINDSLDFSFAEFLLSQKHFGPRQVEYGTHRRIGRSVDRRRFARRYACPKRASDRQCRSRSGRNRHRPRVWRGVSSAGYSITASGSSSRNSSACSWCRSTRGCSRRRTRVHGQCHRLRRLCHGADAARRARSSGRFYYDHDEGPSLRDYVTTVAWFLLGSSLVVGLIALVVCPWILAALIPGLPLPFAFLAILTGIAFVNSELQSRLVQAREQLSNQLD